MFVNRPSRPEPRWFPIQSNSRKLRHIADDSQRTYKETCQNRFTRCCFSIKTPLQQAAAPMRSCAARHLQLACSPGSASFSRCRMRMRRPFVRSSGLIRTVSSWRIAMQAPMSRDWTCCCPSPRPQKACRTGRHKSSPSPTASCRCHFRKRDSAENRTGWSASSGTGAPWRKHWGPRGISTRTAAGQTPSPRPALPP